MRLRSWFVALLGMSFFGLVVAQPQIRSITLEGCKVTNPKAVLEAANIREGMDFDEVKVRQTLLELGLFDSVYTQHQSLADNAVLVTITISEKELPTPKTAPAAKALNLPALALRCFENEASSLSLNLKGGFAFHSPLPVDLPEWRPSRKTSWAKKFVQWQSSRDKRLKEKLLKELDNFLSQYSKDVEARLARAVLLAETEKTEEFRKALSEIQKIMAQHPNLHWSYPLRLSVLVSSTFSLHLLPQRLPRENSKQVSLTIGGGLNKPPLEPSETSWLRGEYLLAIEEGERYFRQLPSKHWDKEAIKAAAKFFCDATSANFLLAVTKAIEEVAKEYGEEFLPPENLAEPFTRYFSDFLRISQIAQRFPKDAEVQWSMAMWGLQIVSSLFMTSLPAIVPEFGDPDDNGDDQLSRLGKTISVQLNLYRPALERWGWHLQRVIALDRNRASKAFALLAIQRAVMGDFNSARQAIEKGLQQPNPDDHSLVQAIGSSALIETLTAAANHPSEEHNIVAALRRRYADWVSHLQVTRPSMPYLTFARAVFRLGVYYKPQAEGETLDWKSFPESVRREVVKILRESAERNFRSDFAQRIFGLTLLLEGESERALPYLQKAYELNPQWFNNGYTLALGYLMVGDIEKALTLFHSQH